MLKLRGRSTGIVLSGGGAKGAYQVGMFEALEQAGLERSSLTLAGTSIGAINAVLYAVYQTTPFFYLAIILLICIPFAWNQRKSQ